MGNLRVADPDGLTDDLEGLRRALLADPYFRGVPSFDPARRKTA